MEITYRLKSIKYLTTIHRIRIVSQQNTLILCGFFKTICIRHAHRDGIYYLVEF